MTAEDNEPPLVDVKVTNPLTYIKRWWARIIGNEGMEFRFKVRPLTSIAIALVTASVAFGVGRIVLPFKIPFLSFEKYEPNQTPSASPTPILDPWRETAFTGTLQFSDALGRFYLITTSSEAITLEIPGNIDLKDFIGRRIFAAGKYNKATRTLVVSSASDLELLPKKPSPIPTIIPTLIPSPTETSQPQASPTETISQ